MTDPLASFDLPLDDAEGATLGAAPTEKRRDFVARFASPADAEPLIHALTGYAQWAEPPTGWEGDFWTVRGSVALEHVELAEAAGIVEWVE